MAEAHLPEAEPKTPPRGARIVLGSPTTYAITGRVIVLLSLLYVFAGSLLSLARVGFRAVAGGRPQAEHIADPLRAAIARGKAVVPVIAVGLLVAFVGWVLGIVRRRRAGHRTRNVG
ncbi:MAG: hypothetical protein ISS72_01960 [Candidatus Brocadiae bacterium]|nr:hypothetical protein [Candidatus Brocadiia bacterium]